MRKQQQQYQQHKQPEDKDQRIVQTPYGRGLVIRTRKEEINNIQQKNHNDEKDLQTTTTTTSNTIKNNEDPSSSSSSDTTTTTPMKNKEKEVDVEAHNDEKKDEDLSTTSTMKNNEDASSSSSDMVTTTTPMKNKEKEVDVEAHNDEKKDEDLSTTTSTMKNDDPSSDTTTTTTLIKNSSSSSKNIKTKTNTIREIRLLDWDMASSSIIDKNKSSSSRSTSSTFFPSKSTMMLYTSNEYPTFPIKIGDDVMTPYGRGKVLEIVMIPIENNSIKEEKEEESTNNNKTTTTTTIVPKYTITLTHWRLSHRSKVKLHLFSTNNNKTKNNIHLLRPKTLHEMTTPYERIEHARSLKSSATPLFQSKQYVSALSLYAQAVDAVRFVQHDASSNNEMRADLVEVMVTCCNNAGTCCVLLEEEEKEKNNKKKWDDGMRFAKNALVLLDALWDKKDGKVCEVLRKDMGGGGVMDAKVFGEWRVKSFLIWGRCLWERGEDEECLDVLRKARVLVEEFGGGGKKEGGKVLKGQDREVRRLMAKCLERRKMNKKKEKMRAKAMFAGSSLSSSSSSASSSSSKSKGMDKVSVKKALNGTTHNASPPTDLTTNSIKTSINTSSSPSNDNNNNNNNKDASLNNKKKSLLNKSNTGHRVSFKPDIAEVTMINQNVDSDDDYDDDDDDDDEPWYEKHMEALILVGAAAGLTALSMVALRKR